MRWLHNSRDGDDGCDSSDGDDNGSGNCDDGHHGINHSQHQL